MTDPALIERITRSLAFMLRHQPETFDLELDTHGFADLEDVVQALNERLGEPVEEEDVRAAVGAGDRPRYEIQGDRIRALYGHSIPVDPGPSSKPPEYLFVAVPEQEIERARRFGLRGGRRRFLHLAATREDAAESGRRASRDYTVLVIHALDAWEEGISFYDRTALWLADEVPTHLIEIEGTYHDGTDPEPRHFDSPRERGGRERTHEPQGHGESRGRRGRGRGRGRGGRDRGPDRERDRPEHRQARRGHESRGDPGSAREPARGRSAATGDGRHAGGDEGRADRREWSREGRGSERREEPAPERSAPGIGDEAREAGRDRPGAAQVPEGSRIGFGAGLDEDRHGEPAKRSAPPPPPSAAPAEERRREMPGFGAGL